MLLPHSSVLAPPLASQWMDRCCCTKFNVKKTDAFKNERGYWTARSCKNHDHFMRESAGTVAPNSVTALGQCHANGSDKNSTCLDIGAQSLPSHITKWHLLFGCEVVEVFMSPSRSTLAAPPEGHGVNPSLSSVGFTGSESQSWTWWDQIHFWRGSGRQLILAAC